MFRILNFLFQIRNTVSQNYFVTHCALNLLSFGVGRAAEPEEGIPARPGGGEEDPVRPARHRPVPGGRGPEHRHCRLNHRQQLLCQVICRIRIRSDLKLFAGFGSAI